jgi:hypothetical protein
MDAPMGRAFSFFLLNQFSRLPYDPVLEQQCLNLISNDDARKQCWQAVVHWQYSTVTGTSQFLCEFTMKCADLATLDYFGDTLDQFTLYSTDQVETPKRKEITSTPKGKVSGSTKVSKPSRTSTSPHQKRSVQEIIQPDPTNVSSYWFPRNQIENQLNGNQTAIQEWWSTLPGPNDNRTDWPNGWRSNNTFHPKYNHELPDGSPQWCLYTFYKNTVGVHFSVINGTLYDRIVNDNFIDVPVILNDINDVENFGELFYFYSFLYQEFLLGDLCPCC